MLICFDRTSIYFFDLLSFSWKLSLLINDKLDGTLFGRGLFLSALDSSERPTFDFHLDVSPAKGALLEPRDGEDAGKLDPLDLADEDVPELIFCVEGDRPSALDAGEIGLSDSGTEKTAGLVEGELLDSGMKEGAAGVGERALCEAGKIDTAGMGEEALLNSGTGEASLGDEELLFSGKVGVAGLGDRELFDSGTEEAAASSEA